MQSPRFYQSSHWRPFFDEQGFGLAHIAGNVHVLPVGKLKRTEIKIGNKDRVPMPELHETQQTLNFSAVTDGASNTILIGTVAQRFKPWGHPVNVRDPSRGINKSPDGFGGPASWNGAMFSFCDGHTAFMSNKIDPRVLEQLATPAGGETLDRAY
jgi:prepilin-type processing-associated H-X9-DG protein